MATKIRMFADLVSDRDQLAKRASDYIAQVEADGGWYKESHVSLMEHDGQPYMLLTVVVDDGRDGAPKAEAPNTRGG
jgi:hypothetical protein